MFIPASNVLPEDFLRPLLDGVVAFEMPKTDLEYEYNLEQIRTAADQAGIPDGLRTEGVESRSLADFIAQRLAEASRAEPSTAAESRYTRAVWFAQVREPLIESVG